MNLEKKKRLAARTFGVGVERIIFHPGRIDEIKEAITKQDMRDLMEAKAIMIKEIKGKLKHVRRKTKIRAGKIKKRVGTRKEDYAKLTRKLRRFAKQLKLQERITLEQYNDIRKQIKSKLFRSKSHFKEIVKIEQSKKTGKKTSKKITKKKVEDKKQ